MIFGLQILVFMAGEFQIRLNRLFFAPKFSHRHDGAALMAAFFHHAYAKIDLL
jgi:hypothetical protein